jgi:hypothetical protein
MRALENGGQRLSAEAREAQFRKMFNLDTGKRRLTCKSRLPVPESIVESDRRDEWPGMSIAGRMLSTYLRLKVVRK